MVHAANTDCTSTCWLVFTSGPKVELEWNGPAHGLSAGDGLLLFVYTREGGRQLVHRRISDADGMTRLTWMCPASGEYAVAVSGPADVHAEFSERARQEIEVRHLSRVVALRSVAIPIATC